MHVRAILVRITPRTIERIKAVAGRYRMSAFIRKAAEAELVRRERPKAKRGKPQK